MLRSNVVKHKALASSNPVFVSHRWGSSVNAGKDYKRPYNKTRSSAKDWMKQQDNEAHQLHEQ